MMVSRVEITKQRSVKTALSCPISHHLLLNTCRNNFIDKKGAEITNKNNLRKNEVRGRDDAYCDVLAKRYGNKVGMSSYQV